MEQDNPSLACESCGASISLERVRRLEDSVRSIECSECDHVMTWSLASSDVIDLRERPRPRVRARRRGGNAEEPQQ